MAGNIERERIPKLGDVAFSGNVLSGEDGRYDLGDAEHRWRRLFVKEITVSQITYVTEPAIDADTVDGFHASSTPTAGYLLALDGSLHFPSSTYADALLRDGTRGLTADWDAGSFSITAAGLTINGDIVVSGNVDGVNVDDHSSRHDPGGADALTTAVVSDVSLQANAEGSAGSLARADHLHHLSETITPTWTGKHTWGTSTEINFRDTALRIYSSADGQLDIDADVKLEIVAPTVSIDGDIDFVGAQEITTSSGNLTLAPAGNLSIDADISFVGAQQIVTTADNLTLAPSGDLIVDPAGNDVLPGNNYDINLGALNLKYLTLHAAELWVETLVAQNTIATIGGRILVGPTTKLTSDVGVSDTTIYVEHNTLADGDTVYLEANSKVEFIEIDSTPGGVGPYSYTVIRNKDGSGANEWYAGDAVFNTGASGDGFMDIYSFTGMDGAATGPAIVGNVRNTLTYNDWTEHWAIGNLNGLYGYGVDTYGLGLGKYGGDHIVIDPSGGIRFRDSSNNVQAQLTGGAWTIGRVGASLSNVYIAAGAVQLRTNTTVNLELTTAGAIIVGDDSSGKYVTVDSGGIEMFANSIKVVDIDGATGDFIFGQVAASKANLFWDQSEGRLNFRTNTSTKLWIDTDGSLRAGGNMIMLDDTAIHLVTGSGSAATYINWHYNTLAGDVDAQIYTYQSTKAYLIGRAVGISGGEHAVVGLRAEHYDTSTKNSTLYLYSDDNPYALFSGYIGIPDGITAPSGLSNVASIYVDTSDSILKVRHGTGTPISLEKQGGSDTGSSWNGSGNITIQTTYTTVASHSVTVGAGQTILVHAHASVYCSGWTSNDYVQFRIYDGTTSIYQTQTLTANGLYYTFSMTVKLTKTGTYTMSWQAIKASTNINAYVPQYYGILTTEVVDEV